MKPVLFRDYDLGHLKDYSCMKEILSRVTYEVEQINYNYGIHKFSMQLKDGHILLTVVIRER